MRHILANVESIDYPDNTFGGLLSDPPYGWSFCGKKWDSEVPGAEIWREVLRVLRPGAYGLVFCGGRTSHIMGTSLATAGWEIKDKLYWLFGSGFPKSHNLSKSIDRAAGAEREVIGKYPGATNYGEGQPGYRPGTDYGQAGRSVVSVSVSATASARLWDGYGTALKPAVEEIFLIQKPREGTYAENAVEWGCGALNIDSARIPTGDSWDCSKSSYGGIFGLGVGVTNPTGHPAGRWPANLLMDESAGEMLDRQTGEQCSRFFYCSKVSAAERAAGVTGDAVRRADRNKTDGSGGENPRNRTNKARINHHPTVKPIDLCRYLAGLIMPPESRKLLVPFAGVGSEMIGAHLAGWTDIVGIERDAEYHKIQQERCRWWIANGLAEMSAMEIIKTAAKSDPMQTYF